MGVIFLDDEKNILSYLKRTFADAPFSVWTAETTAGVRDILAQEGERVRVVVSDRRMPECRGEDFLQEMQQRFPRIVRILFTGSEDDSLEDAVRKGCIDDYILKPWNDFDLHWRIEQAVAIAQLRRDESHLQQRVREQEQLVHYTYDHLRRICDQRKLFPSVDAVMANILDIQQKLLPAIQRPTVLLVDDEPHLVALMKSALNEAGYDVVTAANGQEALERLERVMPALIVLDVNMPHMNGLEFYQQISTQHGRARYPVLILTARANLEQTFRDIDVDGFMSKPFDVKAFVDEVQRIIDGRTRRAIYLLDLEGSGHAPAIQGALSREKYEVFHLRELAGIEDDARPSPHCLILECPSKDPAAVIEHLRALPMFQTCPVIAYTYNKDFPGMKDCARGGVDKFLQAPERYEAFVMAVREIELQRRPPAASAGRERGGV